MFVAEEDHAVLPNRVDFVEHPSLVGRLRTVARERMGIFDAGVDGGDAENDSNVTP